MKIILAFLLIAVNLNVMSQENSCAKMFDLPETFDAKTSTDSTRYAPVFKDASPSVYSFEISNKWGNKVFTTTIPEQGWNGRTNNRGEMNPNGTYMWIMTFTLSEDTVEYACTGFVTCVDMEMKTTIAPFDTLTCRPTLFLPNAFTPNGDGTNDVFMPLFGCPPLDYEMLIFDRWGNLIFQTKDVNSGWDAKLASGQIAQTDTYVWQIKCRYYEGDKARKYIGHVSLIR